MTNADLPLIPHSSPNYGARRGGAKPSMIILHYTGMATGAAALARMCDPKAQVSAHYMVGEEGEIYALVPEDKRAWHAGNSYWAGERDINSHSLGIEMVNRGADPYPSAQITAVIALCQDIMTRYKIAHVLAHSDVAPARKKDPGAQFPWDVLALHNIGMMPRPNMAPVEDTRVALLALGYDPNCETPALIRAFQRHWAPPVNGRACPRTRRALAGML